LEFNKLEAKLAEAKNHEIEETEKKSMKEMASKREEEIKDEEEEFICPFNINNLWNFIEASWISVISSNKLQSNKDDRKTSKLRELEIPLAIICNNSTTSSSLTIDFIISSERKRMNTKFLGKMSCTS
jgi:hypothetical protein